MGECWTHQSEAKGEAKGKGKDGGKGDFGGMGDFGGKGKGKAEMMAAVMMMMGKGYGPWKGKGRGGGGGGDGCKWCQLGECWTHGQISKEENQNQTHWIEATKDVEPLAAQELEEFI